MTPKQIIKALKDTPEVLQILIDCLHKEGNLLEHYWALSIENDKVKIHYEYYGKEDHIPNKYIHKNLIPLHSHNGMRYPPELNEIFEKETSEWIGDEIDLKNNNIHGTTKPSWQDLVSFIWDNFGSFGICSLYNNYFKISFYDPTQLSEKDLRCLLDALYEHDKKVLRALDKDDNTVEDVIALLEEQFKMWEDIDCLKRFSNGPYAAHLIVPF